jgi:hypothetical protein
MNPGPAMSTLLTPAASRSSRSIRRAASTRGFSPSGLASIIARLVLQSPFAASRGRSSSGAIESGAPSSRAALTNAARMRSTGIIRWSCCPSWARSLSTRQASPPRALVRTAWRRVETTFRRMTCHRPTSIHSQAWHRSRSSSRRCLRSQKSWTSWLDHRRSTPNSGTNSDPSSRPFRSR